MATKVAMGAEPWTSGWNRLISNPHAQLNWIPRPVEVVYRGTGYPENYSRLYNDIAAAYQCALRYQISGDTRYADKAVEIMNAWSYILTSIQGSSDKFLAAGIYGYQFANVGEMMRNYPGGRRHPIEVGLRAPIFQGGATNTNRGGGNFQLAAS